MLEKVTGNVLDNISLITNHHQKDVNFGEFLENIPKLMLYISTWKQYSVSVKHGFITPAGRATIAPVHYTISNKN